MTEWSANGAQLGWLIDPDIRIVETYWPGLSTQSRNVLFWRGLGQRGV